MSERSGVHEQPDPSQLRTSSAATGGESSSESAIPSGAFPRLVPPEVDAATPPDLEHQLVFANVSKALFGRGPTLQIGKYTVEQHIGEGGMGEVYLCRDPDLGRKVAIKRVLGSASPRARARLRREAQALAALDHVNVVAVHESGDHDGRLYVVMEYVEGQTLRQWMAEPHPWTAVLDAMIAAGRGLAAAHAAGIVHRDFKPENVLMSHTGAVRVADFGLALRGEEQLEGTLEAGRPSAEAGVTTQSDPGSSPGTAATHRAHRLSRVGAVVGTREYMPLEQLLGAEVDARSDQFAFCMTLYEALWHEPAFPYAGPSERRRLLQTSTPRRPPNHRALYRILRRGLAADPNERWPDMASLLDALERVPRRRRMLAVGALVVPLLAGIGALLATRTPAPVVVPTPALALEAPSVATPGPPPPAIAEEVGALRAELARVAQLRLAGELARARSTLDELGHSVEALDHGPLTAEWHAELGRTLEASGEAEDAAEAYDRALDLAERHHHLLLAAEVGLQRAELDAFELDDLRGAELRYEQAERLASRVPDDPSLAASLAFGRGRLALAHHDHAGAEQHIRAALTLADDDAPQRPHFLAGHADVLAATGDSEGALQLRRQAHEAATLVWGTDHPHTAKLMIDYGLALGRDDARGQALRSQAVEHARARAGARATAWADLQAAALALDLGRVGEARALLERSTTAGASPSCERGDALMILAGFEGTDGQLDEAVVHAEAALEQYDGSRGTVSAQLTGGSDQRALETRAWLANVLLERGAAGDHEHARELLLEIVERVEDHPRDSALAHLGLAELALLEGQLDEADAQLRSCARAHAGLGVDDALAHALLRAVVDLRRGAEQAPSSVEAFTTRLDQTPEHRAELGAWLELEPRERHNLGL